MKKSTLHKIAPLLSEISPENTGFVVPGDYFETIENEISAKFIAENFTNKQDESTFEIPLYYFDTVEDLVLAKLKVEALQTSNTSALSENYFDTLENTVLNKIKENPTIFSLKRSITHYLAPFAIAASLLLIFVLNSDSETPTFESIATLEIENWIDNGYADIDALSIASIYSDVELDIDNLNSSLSDNEVLEYLESEDIDEIIYDN